MAGFFGVLILFLKTNLFIKIISISVFINCFLSKAFFVSFTQYIVFVACLYFYILCTKIKDFSPVFKMLQALMILHLILFFMQIIGKDPLLNFHGRTCYGVVGQNMQSASFMVILSAALIPCSRWFLIIPFFASALCHSAGAFLSGVFGLVTRISKKHAKAWTTILIIISTIFALMFYQKIILYLTSDNGRLHVWFRSLQITFEHPFAGWGIGTYKIIFPAMCGFKYEILPWMNAHNCWVQLFFECGIFIFLLVAGYAFGLISKLVYLVRRKIFRVKAQSCLMGLAMIGSNMIWHFPTREIQTVLIIIFFLAYCERLVTHGLKQD